MWVKVNISVKAKSQAVNLSQRNYDNIKRPKPKDNLLRILKIYAFSQKIQQRTLCPGESAAGIT